MTIAFDAVVRCDMCKGFFSGQALTPAIGYSGDEYICSACLENNYSLCESCGENVLFDLLLPYHSKQMCPTCIEDEKREAEERRDMREHADFYEELDRLDDERRERSLWL